MNFYIDFEATQPEQEIISIGAYSDRGRSFWMLVKPQFSKVSEFVTELTGITEDRIKNALSLNYALCKLYTWCYSQEMDLTKWNFFSYGDSDVDFLKHSLKNIQTEQALVIASIMIATMKDYSQEVKKYFNGSVSLIKAFNYFEELENKQKHDALEDAIMLSRVFKMVESADCPLDKYPFENGKVNSNSPYVFPSGTFYCKKENCKEIKFDSVQDAITWLLNNKIDKNTRENVHRDRIAKKIMKAIRKKETYMELKWRREKK